MLQWPIRNAGRYLGFFVAFLVMWGLCQVFGRTSTWLMAHICLGVCCRMFRCAPKITIIPLRKLNEQRPLNVIGKWVTKAADTFSISETCLHFRGGKSHWLLWLFFQINYFKRKAAGKLQCFVSEVVSYYKKGSREVQKALLTWIEALCKCQSTAVLCLL